MAVVIVFTITMIFINAFECKRPSDAWSMVILDQQHPEKCWNLTDVYYAQAAFSIFSDATIILLPIPAMLGLNLQRHKRLGVIALFSCGSIAVVASGVRLYALWLYFSSTDAAWYSAFILICSQVELNVAIMTASFPMLKPLFKPKRIQEIQWYGNEMVSPYWLSGTNSRSGTRVKSQSATTERSVRRSSGEQLFLYHSDVRGYQGERNAIRADIKSNTLASHVEQASEPDEARLSANRSFGHKTTTTEAEHGSGPCQSSSLPGIYVLRTVSVRSQSVRPN